MFMSDDAPRPTSSPTAIPISPPIPVSVAASIRNCSWISPRDAPSALRTPISRVRAVTDTIMIAITPIPPTMSATDASTIMVRKKMSVIEVNTLRIWS